MQVINKIPQSIFELKFNFVGICFLLAIQLYKKFNKTYLKKNKIGFEANF